MRRVNKNKMVQDFQLHAFGAKGWLGSKYLACPYCGKRSKFGVIFTEDGNSGVYHCFYCDKKGSIFSLLKEIKREDLIIRDGDDNEYNLSDKLDLSLNIMTEKQEDLECPEIPMPLGWKQLTESEYLEKRGWEKWQLELYHAGTTLEPKLKGKITFLLYEDGKLIGYLSRSTKSKAWHKKNLEDYKAGKAKLVLRYDNSTSTQFEKVLGGIDEVSEQTHTVILVEGIMDKANTDKVLHLNESPEVKCCFTFGCKLSEAQMLKLYKKGVKNVILCYDPGTIQQVKSAGLKLSKKFNIKIGELKGEKDPGEMNFCDFEEVFVNLLSPMEYYANRLQIGQLK